MTVSKSHISWTAISVGVGIILWLMAQFNLDVADANARNATLREYHESDISFMLKEFDKIDETRDSVLGKLAGNEVSHKNIDATLVRMNAQLDKIYDLLIEERKK